MIRFVDYNNDKKEACYSFCAVSENNQCAERVYGHCLLPELFRRWFVSAALKKW